LVVYDFGVKYTNKADVDHLIICLKEHYDLTQDWNGDLYCGIKLKWNYEELTLNISMPGYIIKQLQKYKHDTPTKPQHCPYSPQPKQFGSEAQRPIPQDTPPPLSKEDIKHIQRVIGSILYYARAVDLTVLMALSTIASEQAHGTENTMQKTKQLLEYFCNSLEGNRAISRIRHGIKYPFRFLIFIRSECLQQSMRALFYGMESRPHKAHQIERGIFYIVYNFTLRRRVRRRGQTWSIISQLQTSINF
jgi:hypothetical protein